MRRLWNYIAWSFQALAAGKWPARDAEGRPLGDPRAGEDLAGGFVAILWVFRADMDYLDLYLGLESFRQDDRLCPWCRAGRIRATKNTAYGLNSNHFND